MKIKILCALLLSVSAFQMHAADAPLFRMSIDKAPTAGVDTPAMVFQEIERSDSASTVELSHAAGSAVAKSMFLLRGACALAKERAKQAFTVEPLSRQPVRFVLRFTTGEPASPAVPGRSMSEGGVVSADLCEAAQSMMRK